jgi:dTMP kinase
MPFIVLEGIEGSGKSTQSRRLAEALGPDVVVTQEPGGTRIGLSVRDLLLDRRNTAMADETELLLYFADRAQHVRELVLPALRAGRLVISDRYVQSTIAYQGYGRGIRLETIDALWQIATGGLRPDLLVLLDVPIELGLERVRERGAANRLEIEQRAFYERVQAGYRRMVSEDPERWIVVDGTADPRTVTPVLLAAIEARGLLARPPGVR